MLSGGAGDDQVQQEHGENALRALKKVSKDPSNLSSPAASPTEGSSSKRASRATSGVYVFTF